MDSRNSACGCLTESHQIKLTVRLKLTIHSNYPSRVKTEIEQHQSINGVLKYSFFMFHSLQRHDTLRFIQLDTDYEP